jgi:hypothetical protein
MTATRTPASAPVRLAPLALGGLSLLGGAYAALLLLGLRLPLPRPELDAVHGPVMVLGFVGTLVAMERAVALGARWALLAPACAGVGGLLLLGLGPTLPGKLLLAVAGAAFLLVYRGLWRRQPSVALLAQAAGAFSWYAAALLWAGGFSVAEAAPWLVGFVVLTIAGERLELSRVALPHGAEPAFLAVLALMVAAMTATTLWPGPGHQLLGLALLATVGWLLRYDVAWRTVRLRGLPRYVAVGLLAGYAWLAVAALLWAGAGPSDSGARYEAVLHAVFLGFTMSMIFVHAPVILPATLRLPLPYHPVLYAPLALLHLSLLTRLGLGDLFGLVAAWRWSGVANVVAVLGFVASAATLTTCALRSSRSPAARTATTARIEVPR